MTVFHSVIFNCEGTTSFENKNNHFDSPSRQKGISQLGKSAVLGCLLVVGPYILTLFIGVCFATTD